MQSFKVLGALLTYPSERLASAARSGELAAVLEREPLFDTRQVGRLRRLLRELAEGDLLDLQEGYVNLFDRSKARSLYLFEHVHGESRDRGQAMIDLHEMYAEVGLELADNELPDFLPVFLEYLACLEPEAARARLAQPVHLLATLARRLEERGSSYAPVLALLEELSAEPADAEAVAELLAEADDDPDDTERLDAEWEEQPVTFGPSAAPGGTPPCERMAGIADRLMPSAPRNS
jgi:nitrate reductase delta subunit